MLKEDRLVENLTFIAYFVAAALAWGWSWSTLRRGSRARGTAIGCLGFGCFVLGMEEISWCERWLHFRIPDLILRNNVQQESTVHNLGPFQDVSVWVPIIVAGVALAAILAHTRPRRDVTGVPSLLLPYALVVLALSGYDNLTAWMPLNARVDTIIGMLEEHVEMLVAFGFALGIGLAMRRERVYGGSTPPGA
jgi:hypothetical protein